MDIITKTAKDAMKLLDAIRAQYAIILPTGERYGGLEVTRKKVQKAHAPKPPKPRAPDYIRGEVTQHVTTHIKDMGVGDVGVVPIDKFPKAAVRLTVGRVASAMWGKDTYKIATNNEAVEVLRTA